MSLDLSFFSPPFLPSPVCEALVWPRILLAGVGVEGRAPGAALVGGLREGEEDMFVDVESH